MKKNYLELSRYITSYFPDLQSRVSGGVDRPPELWILISQITSMLQILGMAFVVLGDKLLEMVGISPATAPKWLQSAKENKMVVFFGLFFLNNVANGKLATGAFEVEYNGITVYSKLATGRMPSVQEVIKAIETVRMEYEKTLSA
ncbi:hypothetical protein TrLO_g6919 [Triparma laevis f. longispina]|uniref:Selenoprotein T n=1 Tax=Triparma laevis f. longispina TaxID=1714387 RepID=A0A9W7C3J6_9STRA|nr:hypothetical protein TrLO_g6919 [Triparma laevis f. longispina]